MDNNPHDWYIKIFNAIGDLRSLGYFCDAQLQSTKHGPDQKKNVDKDLMHYYYPCHKIIMACHSPVFLSHILSSQRERINAPTTSLKHDIFTLPCPNHISEKILQHVYGNDIFKDENLSTEDVFELLQWSDNLQLDAVADHSWKWLTKYVNTYSCLQCYHLAKLYKRKSEKTVFQNYAKKHLDCVIKDDSKGFGCLEVSDVIELLSDDYLEVQNEQLVYDGVMKWVAYDRSSREIIISHIVALTVRCNLQENLGRFVSNGKLKTYNHSFTCNMKLAEARNRVPYSLMLVLGGWYKGEVIKSPEFYNHYSQEWCPLSGMGCSDAVARAYHGVAFHATTMTIYLIGGEGVRSTGSANTAENCLNSVLAWNAHTSAWDTRACLHERRCYVSVCTYGKFIFAIGGYNGHCRLRSMERYEPGRNQWLMMANMALARSDAAVVVCDDRIYAIGGFTGEAITNTAECYLIDVDQWIRVTSMQHARSGVRAMWYDYSIYVLGGYNGEQRLSVVERYDPHSRQWHEMSNMLERKSNFALATFHNRLYVIGGYNGLTTVNTVECYDFTIGTWCYAAPLKQSRSACSAVVVKDSPFSDKYPFHYYLLQSRKKDLVRASEKKRRHKMLET